MISLSPCPFSLICGIVHAWHEGESRRVNERVYFFFYIVCESFGVGSSFISVLKSLLGGDSWHDPKLIRFDNNNKKNDWIINYNYDIPGFGITSE